MTQTYGKGKRFITLLLAVVMLFSLALPAAAVSETESTAEPTAEAAATPTPEAPNQPSEAPAVSAGPETESKTEDGETQPLYTPARAEKDGYFVLAAETSADGVTTDGFALAPVRVEYKTGDTILDAVARLEDVTVSERFGADVETGRITLNDEEYIAACDTHVGVMTLTDMYRPEEVHVVRLHQSVQSENGKDYFPEALQNLLRAMAAAEDRERKAYLAAVESYGEAVESPALAAKLTAALGWTPESEASPTPVASQTPAPSAVPADGEDASGTRETPVPAATPSAPATIAPVRVQPAARTESSDDAEKSPSASPSGSPAASPSASPSAEPSEEPGASPTAEPSETPKPHSPELVYGVEAEASEVTAVNRAWNLDLTKIFTDYNNDDLTYTVAMDGGEEETVEGTVYSFTPDAVGEHTLVFAAACAASELRAVYTVKLSVQEGVYEVRFSISYAGIDLPDATLTLRDANYQLVPHTQGNYNFMLRPGKYMYSVSMEGYEDVEQVIIKVVESDEPMVINVEMAPTQTVKYPVMFYLTDTDGNAVTGATVTVASLDYNNQKTTSTEAGDGYYSFSLPRGRYTYTVSCKEGYGHKMQGWNWVVYDYREIYEPCGGELTVQKTTGEQKTELTLTRVNYPWLTGFQLSNGGGVTAREDQDAWNILQGVPYSEPITLHFDGPDYGRISTSSYTVYPIGSTQPDAAAEITYTNLSGEEKTLSFTFNGVLIDENGQKGWKPNDLANEVDGSGRFTLTLTRGEQVQQYNVELLLHRTLKSLTVSANGEAALLGPAFSRDITEYNVEVPEGTKALFITATPFFTESRGYRVTINGEEVTGGETAEVSFAGGSADVKITVSHTADEARGLASATTYTLHVTEGVARAYDTRFAVTGGGAAIVDAEIAVFDVYGQRMTASAEDAYTYSLLTGDYTYEITAEGYKKETGSFTVGMAGRTVNVALEPETYEDEMLLKALIVGGSEWDGSAWQYTPVLRTDVRPGVFEYHVPLTGDSYFGHIKAEFSEGATVSLEYTHGYDDNSSTSHSEVYDLSNGGWAMSYLGERYGVVGEEQKRTVRVTLGDVEQVYTFYYSPLPELWSISVSTDVGPETLSPVFSGRQESYTVAVPMDAQRVYIRTTMNYKLTDEPAKSVSIDGVRLPADCHGRYVTLSTDENGRQTIPVTISYKASGVSRTYMLTVQREERHDTPMLKSVYFEGALKSVMETGFQPDRYY